MSRSEPSGRVPREGFSSSLREAWTKAAVPPAELVLEDANGSFDAEPDFCGEALSFTPVELGAGRMEKTKNTSAPMATANDTIVLKRAFLFLEVMLKKPSFNSTGWTQTA